MFASLIQFITKKQRVRVKRGVDFEWSKGSWTHNVFRVLELVFGREFGIRAESAAWRDGDTTYYECYTLEASVAYVESVVRAHLKKLFSWKLVYAPIPVLALPNGFGLPSRQLPWLFAIATDATADGGSTTGTSLSWNHTCTGSNLLLTIGAEGDLTTNNINGATYNSVSMTQVGTGQNGSVGSLRWTYFFWLLNPATGTHSASISSSSSLFLNGVSASYSGVKQSGQPDASNTGAFGNTTVTLTVTVVAANSWFIGSFFGRTTGVAGTGATQRIQTGTSGAGIYDSNGGLAAGSQSMSTTWSGGVNAGNAVGASFAPVPAAVNGNFLAFM